MGVLPITGRLLGELWHHPLVWSPREGNENTVHVQTLEDYLCRSHEDEGEQQPGKYETLVKNLSATVMDLLLSARAVATSLRMLWICHVYEVVERPSQELGVQPTFGKKSLREVEDKLWPRTSHFA